MNGCQECNGIDQCINKWNFHCDSSYSTSTYYDGKSCSSSGVCGCTSSAFNNYLSSSYSDNYKEVPISLAKNNPDLDPLIVNGKQLEIVISAKLLGIVVIFYH